MFSFLSSAFPVEVYLTKWSARYLQPPVENTFLWLLRGIFSPDAPPAPGWVIFALLCSLSPVSTGMWQQPSWAAALAILLR